MQHRFIGRLALATAGAVLMAVAAAAPASAHVHADGALTAGGYAVVTFRVPTESDAASTTAITVTLPAETPLAYVATQTKPGWRPTLVTADLPTPTTNDDGEKVTTYVKSVTWTATGGGIPPEQFDTFALSIGPIPDVKEMVFPTLQTYSDGTRVDWSEIAEGSAEPEHPAPSVPVAAAASASPSETAGPTAAAAGDPTLDHSEPAVDASSGTGTLGLVGIVLGALGVALAAVALVRGSRRPTGQ